MHRFAVVTVEGEELGPFAFARGDFNPGDVIPRGPGQSLAVIRVVPTDGEDRLPLLVVERKGAGVAPYRRPTRGFGLVNRSRRHRGGR